MCVPVCARVCEPRNREGGTRAPLWNSFLFFPLMWWQGRCSHKQLLCFDKSMPHRQDFKGNFQAPSLPSPDEFELGRGEAGWKWRVEHQLWRHRYDNQQQHQNHLWHRHSGRTGSLLTSVFQAGGRCCAFAAGLTYVQIRWEWGATKYYSHHSGSLLPESVCWVLFFLFRKQKSTVISIDSPSHLEPVNNPVVSCLGSSTV